jgi:hypothetical protein
MVQRRRRTNASQAGPILVDGADLEIDEPDAPHILPRVIGGQR